MLGDLTFLIGYGWKLYPNYQPQGLFSPGTTRLSSNMQCALSTILSLPSGSDIMGTMSSHPFVKLRSTWTICFTKYANAKGTHDKSCLLQTSKGIVYLALLVVKSSSVPHVMSLEDTKVTVGLDRLPRYVVPGLAL